MYSKHFKKEEISHIAFTYFTIYFEYYNTMALDISKESVVFFNFILV